MSLQYTIIESEKLVYVIGEGEITLDELLNHLEELSRDPGYVPPMKKLVDYRKAQTMGPKKEEIDYFTGRMASYKEVFQGEKCAIVVNNELDFGISRVYSAKIEASGLETNVFRDIGKALRWLGVDLDEKRLGQVSADLEKSPSVS